MDAERWQRIQDLFDAALERPAAERLDFIAERCGSDIVLRDEVAALLEAHSGSESFLAERLRDGYALLEDALQPGADGKTPPKLGKYEVVERIGQGGFGTVFKGLDPDLRREVAIKVCATSDADLRRRFFREGQIAAALDHPNITRIHDLGFAGEIPFLVQEYLPGHDLDRLIAGGGLATVNKVDLLVQIAAGLAHAHAAGVLHRDIKPSNVRVLGDGTAKILDFGIARLLGTGETRLTQDGSLMGTVGYLSPEQLQGGKVDRSSDLFSFGILAFELLAGQRPFGGESFGRIAYQLVFSAAPSLVEVWPICPDPHLIEIVDRCLEKDREERWASMEEVRDRLGAVRERLRDPTSETRLATDTALDPTEILTDLGGLRRSPFQRRHGRAGRNRRWIGGAALAASLVFGLGSWLKWRGPDEDQALQPSPVQAGMTALAVQTSDPSTPAETVDDAPTDGEASDPQGGDEGETRETGEGSEATPGDVPAQDSSAEDTASGQLDGATPIERASQAVSSAPPRTQVEDFVPPARSTLGLAPGLSAGPTDVAEEVSGAERSTTMRHGDPIVGTELGVVPPEPLETVDPIYPRRARRRNQEAKVIVAVYVDESGKVTQTFLKLADGTKVGFDEAALDAARRTRFNPATRDGVPGKMWAEIPYDFSRPE